MATAPTPATQAASTSSDASKVTGTTLDASVTLQDMADALAPDDAPVKAVLPSVRDGLVVGKKALLTATSSYQVDPISNTAYTPGSIVRGLVTEWVVANYDKEPPLLAKPSDDEPSGE